MHVFANVFLNLLVLRLPPVCRMLPHHAFSGPWPTIVGQFLSSRSGALSRTQSVRRIHMNMQLGQRLAIVCHRHHPPKGPLLGAIGGDGVIPDVSAIKVANLVETPGFARCLIAAIGPDL